MPIFILAAAAALAASIVQDKKVKLLKCPELGMELVRKIDAEDSIGFTLAGDKEGGFSIVGICTLR